MLKLRKRGETWHMRGTIRVGKKTYPVEETTGRRDKGEAQSVALRRAAEIQADLLAGRDPALRHLTFDDVGREYLDRPAGVHASDQIRLELLSAHFGSTSVSAIDAKAWRGFCQKRLKNKSPGTLNRHRTVLLAVLNHGAPVHKYTVEDIPAEDYDPVRVRYLSKDEEGRLLAAYSHPARDVAHFLAGTGRRIGETLRLDRRHVDIGRAEAFFPDPKSGEPQGCILLPIALEAVKRALKRPRVVVAMENGQTWQPLFLSRWNEPYHDTREVGGNPITKAHKTACRRVGIENFRVHDWRHHFATWRLKEGWELSALKKQGGWASYEMLEKYAAVDLEHVHAQVKPTRTKSGQRNRKKA